MNVACIYTERDYIQIEKPLLTAATILFGIATIASILKNAGHNVELSVLTRDTQLSTTLGNLIVRFQPQLFCLTAVYSQFPLINRIAEVVKKIDPSIYVVLGGPYASLLPEEAIAFPAIDGICMGEGDLVILDLAEQIEAGMQPTGIHNFWFKQPGTNIIERNPPEPFNANIDDIPFIDRGLWRPWIMEPDKNPSVLVGRGCPFQCTYCCNHALRKLAPGNYVRFRSPENIIKEIQQITENPSVKDVYLEIETIGANLKYGLQLCQALAEFNEQRRTPVQFKIYFAVTSKLTRYANLMDQLFKMFNRANILSINIGLESISERVRNEVLSRPHYTNSDIICFCITAIRYNIKINLYVMIAIPGETPIDFQQTITIGSRFTSNSIMLSIFYPYPGTKLHRIAKRERDVAG
jgi:anaerobic magnesium-protoporphyrin IX monomethyl ester cyclase